MVTPSTTDHGRNHKECNFSHETDDHNISISKQTVGVNHAHDVTHEIGRRTKWVGGTALFRLSVCKHISQPKCTVTGWCRKHTCWATMQQVVRIAE